jgi:beta-N-acetylhexosaminidase
VTREAGDAERGKEREREREGHGRDETDEERTGMISGKQSGEEDIGVQLLVGFRGTTLEEELKSLIRDFHIGGMVIFKRNVEGPEQLQTLLAKAQEYARERLGRPLWVAIDQEGGPVQRLIPPFTQLPSARALAAQGSEAVREWSARAACELRKIGIHINLAPVLDVVPEGTAHFMAERSLGSDAKQVAHLGEVWIRTLQEQGISATGKHYPGLGRAETDPHHYGPVIRWESKEAIAEDLLPFRQAIQAGVHCIMTSHALYPCLDSEWPATLSPTINHEWLRNRLGFDGILFSDDLDMAAVSERYSFEKMVRQGLCATIDFFLLCQQPGNIEPLYRALAEAIAHDRALADLRRRSLQRIESFARISQVHG